MSYLIFMSEGVELRKFEQKLIFSCTETEVKFYNYRYVWNVYIDYCTMIGSYTENVIILL